MDRGTDVEMDGQAGGRRDGGTEGRKDGWMDGRTDGRTGDKRANLSKIGEDITKDF